MTTTPLDSTAGHVQERFNTRARALVYARLGLMGIGLVVLMVPAWHQQLGIAMPAAAYWYLAILAYHVASQLSVGRRYSRAAIFVTLCLDVLVILYLVTASGGIKSPLMPTQLVLTVLFALLYPSPLALIPPLLALPIMAKVDQILGTQTLPGDLLLLLYYIALNTTLVYIIVYLDQRERETVSEMIGLQGEQRKAELADQRIRIAREIHDGVGASLSGVLLQAEYLTVQLEEGTALHGEMQQLREAAAEGMEELRRAVSVLHRDFMLSTAIPDYVDHLVDRHRIDASCSVEGVEPDLEPEKQLVLFRILQESLANIIRHAQASSVEVLLRFERDRVVLTVADDGVGFEPDNVAEGHYGLHNMRQRAEKSGGKLTVTSSSSGTTIEAVVDVSVPGGGLAATSTREAAM